MQVQVQVQVQHLEVCWFEEVAVREGEVGEGGAGGADGLEDPQGGHVARVQPGGGNII